MRPVLGAVLLVTGAVALSAGWRGGAALVVLAGAVILSYASMLLASRLRMPTPVAALAWLMVLVAVGVIVGARAGLGWSAVLRDGVPRLLTAPRPAPAVPELLFPGAMLAVLTGVWVGGRSVQKGGGRLAPLAGAVGLYIAGALLTAGSADPYGLVAAALILTAVADWVLAERRSSRRPGRVLATLAATAAIALSAATATALVLPAGTAFEPRHLVAPPPLPIEERSPLPRLAALAGEQEVQFRHNAGNWRLHLVALTAFDGSSWRSEAVYRPIGAVGPRTLPGGDRQTTVDAEVAIEALKGPWLPVPGLPREVSMPDVAVDAASGSLVVEGGARSGLRYQVRATVDTPSDEALLVAGVPSAPELVAVPRLPFAFSEYARQVVQGAGTPFEQAALIEAAVREGRRLDPGAPAGSSYARLDAFLFGQSSSGAGSRAGTSEQFSTAFAVLARSVGLPTRIVFGFGPGQQAADGGWVVRGADALAWPEVYFSGLGWVPFDPSPTTVEMTGPSAAAKQDVVDRVGSRSPSPTPTRQPPRIDTGGPTTGAGGDVAAPLPADRGAGGSLRQLAMLALAIPVAAVAALMLARSARRQRHRRAGAEGAWSEVLDLLVLLDRAPPHWHTSVRIADDVAAAFPAALPHPVTRLAQAADRAAFCPPGGRVEGSWGDVRRLRQAVRRVTPWHRRLAWLLDPRPLRRR